MAEKRLKKERTGIVTSNRMDKTVVVSMERTVMHPRYKRYAKRRTRVKAHDERNECQVGDRVLIVECRPLSREKRWRVSRILAHTEAEAEAQTEQKEALP